MIHKHPNDQETDKLFYASDSSLAYDSHPLDPFGNYSTGSVSDKIVPPGFNCFLLSTVLFIVCPSLHIAYNSVPEILQNTHVLLFSEFCYMASLLLCLRRIYLCAVTDPGIVPRVRSSGQSPDFNLRYLAEGSTNCEDFFGRK